MGDEALVISTSCFPFSSFSCLFVFVVAILFFGLSMLELGPDNALDYLRSIGQLGSEPARVEAMGWGVSNVVLRVETPDRRFVLKQSRPQLRTRDAWFSDLNRVYREQEVMQALADVLPPLTVPRVLFVDRENFAFAMSHAPTTAAWKD